MSGYNQKTFGDDRGELSKIQVDYIVNGDLDRAELYIKQKKLTLEQVLDIGLSLGCDQNLIDKARHKDNYLLPILHALGFAVQQGRL